MKALIPLAGLGGLFALTIGLCAVGASGDSPAGAAVPGMSACVTSGPLPGLSDTAAANARTVIAVADQLGGPSAAQIAVMVGLTESGMRVLGNPVVDTSGLHTDGTGSNYDSIGIFQQRASWGTVAQRLDPAGSTSLFVQRLLAIDGWQSVPPWVAAQQVQRSAFDGHPRAANDYDPTYGGNYEAAFGRATTLLDIVAQDATRTPCGAMSGGLPASAAPGSHGLPPDYTVPATATSAEATVIAFAIAQLDKPYVFGAAGPDAFDCSGLTMSAWATVGMHLEHSTTAQALEGSASSVAALAPADLVLVPGDDGTLAAPGHVGLYLGDGLVLNAATESVGIRVQTLDDFIRAGHGLSAIRHIA